MTFKARFKTYSLKLFLPYGIALIIFWFIIYYLDSDKGTLLYLRWQAHPWLILAHIILLILMFATFVFGWVLSLYATGQDIDLARRSSFTWLVANLGKYIPGKIFMFAGRIELSKKIGIRRASILSAMTFEHFFLFITTSPFLIWILIQGYRPSSIFVFVIIPLLFFTGILIFIKPQLLLKIINQLLTMMRREPIQFSPSPIIMFFMLCIYLIGWIIYGISGVFLTYAMEIGGNIPFYTIMAAFVSSWAIGFASLLTPAGLGVREAILIFILHPEVPVSQAIVLSILARITWTIIEMSGVIIGLFLGKYLQPKTN